LLKELGYAVDAVNVSKVYNIHLEAASTKDAKVKAEEWLAAFGKPNQRQLHINV